MVVHLLFPGHHSGAIGRTLHSNGEAVQGGQDHGTGHPSSLLQDGVRARDIALGNEQRDDGWPHSGRDPPS